jgi:hypothetical protein
MVCFTILSVYGFADLLKGQLLHEKDSILLEAMSALEVTIFFGFAFSCYVKFFLLFFFSCSNTLAQLFDVKMDGGIGSGKVDSVERAIELGKLPKPDVHSFEQYCLMMDEFLCRQVEYFFGETIAESILTFL